MVYYALALAFGITLLVVAVLLHRLGTSSAAAPYFEIPKTLQNWWFLLFPTPNEISFLRGNELGYEIAVRHRRGYYWTNGKAEIGSVARVSVPLGCIARLGAFDEWSGSRFIESSAFCFFKDEAALTELNVLILQRATRWQIVLRDTKIRTKRGQELRMHVAVHTHIHAAITDVRLQNLFEEHERYMNIVKGWVSSELKSILQNHEYETALFSVATIVATLNQRWASAKSEIQSGVNEIADTIFTGLVIKSRQEGEEARFKVLEGKVQRIEQELRKTHQATRNPVDTLQTRALTTIQSLLRTFAELDGVKGGENAPTTNSFASRIKINGEAAARTVPFDRGGDKLVELVQKPFQTFIADLDQSSTSFINSCAQVEDIIRKIDVEESKQLDEVQDSDTTRDK